MFWSVWLTKTKRWFHRTSQGQIENSWSVYTSKECQCILSAVKMMASGFWNAICITFKDHFEKGHTITGKYYAPFQFWNLLLPPWFVLAVGVTRTCARVFHALLGALLLNLAVTKGYQNEVLGKGAREGALYHEDNAPAHRSFVSMATVCDCGFKLRTLNSLSPSLFSWFDPIWLITWLHREKNT